MKLHSLKIEARRPGGWESAQLFFGKHITELFGPNGSGKTPIIQSIAYALGYPVRYREDILAHCDAVVLTLTTPAESIQVRRRIGGTFDVEVTIGSEQARSFYNERDYSQFMIGLLGFDFPPLTSTGNEAVVPYMSTLLPIFYIDQDLGYTGAYKSPTTFIKDQYAEMMRLVFDLPPKHSFDQKKLTLEKKRRLEQLDRLVVRKTEQIDELNKSLGKLRRPIDAVATEISNARANLDNLRANRGSKSDAQLAIDALLYEKKSLRRQLASEIADIQTRVRSFNKIQNEIEIEVNTLSLNEEARRLFASFKDICAKQDCGLFLGSSESYGKSLLYLRDQIKDLQRNNVLQNARFDALTTEMGELDEGIQSLEGKQSQMAAADDTSGLVEAIGELTRNIIDLQEERTTLETIGTSEEEYVRLLNDRKSVQDELASMEGGAGAVDLRALEIRSAWRARMLHWLDVLQTRNVSREISIDADFEVLFGQETLRQFHGSTLTRVVLALRAAAFEVYARDESKRLRFLILDTPRQQDIEREALARYIAELKTVAIERNAQVVFSTTDYHYECVDDDVQWSPEYDGAEQKMFLRVVS